MILLFSSASLYRCSLSKRERERECVCVVVVVLTQLCTKIQFNATLQRLSLEFSLHLFHIETIPPLPPHHLLLRWINFAFCAHSPFVPFSSFLQFLFSFIPLLCAHKICGDDRKVYFVKQVKIEWCARCARSCLGKLCASLDWMQSIFYSSTISGCRCCCCCCSSLLLAAAAPCCCYCWCYNFNDVFVDLPFPFRDQGVCVWVWVWVLCMWHAIVLLYLPKK